MGHQSKESIFLHVNLSFFVFFFSIPFFLVFKLSFYICSLLLLFATQLCHHIPPLVCLSVPFCLLFCLFLELSFYPLLDYGSSTLQHLYLSSVKFCLNIFIFLYAFSPAFQFFITQSWQVHPQLLTSCAWPQYQRVAALAEKDLGIKSHAVFLHGFHYTCVLKNEKLLLPYWIDFQNVTCQILKPFFCNI